MVQPLDVRVGRAGADVVELQVQEDALLGTGVSGDLREPVRTAVLEGAGWWAEAFAAAGADIINVHVEASPHLHGTIQTIRKLGVRPAITLNPGTPLNVVDEILPEVDMVLIMSVNPGFGGQSFIPSTLDKLRQARALIDASGFDIRLEVDGGVTPGNIGEIAAAGADTFVAGSAIFGKPDYAAVIAEMRSQLAGA